MRGEGAQTNAGFRACAPAVVVALVLQEKLVRTEQLYRSPVSVQSGFLVRLRLAENSCLNLVKLREISEMSREGKLGGPNKKRR
jgi:hypothetical protein